ncbi:MAG: phenylalanine--tRNA ligase subunit alpha [Ruminococcaceae bacterium]|nr:phenylalanine--tRNA ligase subunit alpha [Oscillospiraceae bacterium]
MREQLKSIRENAVNALNETDSSEKLEALRVQYLGKKGELTSVLSQMGKLSAEERPVIGQIANEVRSFIENEIKTKREEVAKIEMEKRLAAESIDVTLPGNSNVLGKKHPLSIVLDEVKDAFISMGFTIVSGPEVEYDYYNFEALNIPKDHPARDTQDTFYFSPEILLRTQTSSVQIRAMEQMKPPIRVLSPGRVYRIDEVDATHSPIFHQIEGLVVDKGITMAHLKGSLELISKKLFGEDIKTRIRPDYFPFTEPSAEISISCFKCGGKGCKFCKGEGWIEIGGAGMVNPKVLANLGIDPNVYSGFAFGMGLERLVLRRYNIDDIRLLLENDVRFLNMFD